MPHPEESPEEAAPEEPAPEGSAPESAPEKPHPEGSAPSLRITGGDLAGTVIRLDRDEGVLGRREEADYVLADLSVSRTHARVSREGGSVIVTDLNSTRGTYVNSSPVETSMVVAHGDRITFGAVATVLEDPRQEAADEEATVVFETPEVETGPQLSPRQQQVLEGIARGLTNSEIAEELGVTTRTVKAYAGELYTKLGASNRAAAVARGIEEGLL